jgi:hypothetical protein
MQFLKGGLIFIVISLQSLNAFQWNTIKNFLKTESTINTLITDEIEVLIQDGQENSKKVFDGKEILQQIQQNKIDKLFINHKNNQILALDKTPSEHMFHWTKMNPQGFNTLIKSSNDHHVSIYYTDFSSSWFVQSHHLWDILPFIPIVYFAWRILDEFYWSSANDNTNGSDSGDKEMQTMDNLEKELRVLQKKK